MIIQGQVFWAKVTGAPGWGYKKQHKEWSIDFCLNEATKKALLEAGMSKSYIKDKGDDRGEFITFRRRELKRDGSPSKPIEVQDHKGRPWDDRKIGNGSICNFKIALNEVDGQTGTKPGLIKMQVVKLVEFEGGDNEDFAVYDDNGEVETWS